MVKNVILISGKLQSGKNTFTDMLMKELQPTGLKVGFDFFAKPVKDQSKEVFENLITYLNEISEKYNIPELKTVEENWYEDKNKITRILLQTYGTKIFRKLVDPAWWEKLLRERICIDRNEEILFITDVRFKTEISTIMDKDSFERHGVTIIPKYNVIKIRVERDNFDRPDDPIYTDESEIDLDDYSDWDLVIKNNSDLSSLLKQAEQTTRFILERVSKKSQKN